MNDNDLIISISEGPKGFGVNDKEQNEFSDGLSENIIEANNEKKKRQNESVWLSIKIVTKKQQLCKRNQR